MSSESISFASESNSSNVSVDAVAPHELTTIKPVRTAFNSKIYLALQLVKDQKIHHNMSLGIYNVVQNDTTYQVTIYPKQQCSCIEKFGCCHILAVLKINGRNIEKDCKAPNLGQLY